MTTNNCCDKNNDHNRCYDDNNVESLDNNTVLPNVNVPYEDETLVATEPADT